MKPAKMGTPDRDVLAADAVTLERQRVLQRAIDEVYFKVRMAAGLVVYEGVVTEPKNGDEVVSRFPAAALGVNAHMQRSVEARDLWPRTRPRVYVFYTSPVGDVKTFNLRFVLRCFGPGSTTVNSIFVTDFSPAGPAVANTVQRATCVGGAVFPSSPFGVAQWRLGRLGGDANPNDLDILLAVVTLEETA